MKLLVQVTMEIEVEFPDSSTKEHPCCDPFWTIEENGCPGTGRVGSALDAVLEAADAEGICGECRLNGSNKILQVNGIEVTEELKERIFKRFK